MKVRIVEPPHLSVNTFRGIGRYAEQLKTALSSQHGIELAELDEDVTHYPFFDLFFHTLPLKKQHPTIVTIHDVIPLVFPREYKPGIKGFMRFQQQKLSLLNTSHIATDSIASKNDIVRLLHVPEKKVSVVYLAGNSKYKKQSADTCERIRLKYELPQNYVLYVGDINYNKNVLSLLRACALLPNEVHLVLVGRNFENTSIQEGQAIQSEIVKNSMQNRVHILDNIPNEPAEEMSAIYTGALAYVQPSFYEGFGFPVLDALQCGTPVACSQTSSLLEVGGEAVVFFDPYSVTSMRDGILRAMNTDKDERWSKTVQAHLSQFSWKKTAEQMVDFYKKVLNEK